MYKVFVLMKPEQKHYQKHFLDLFINLLTYLIILFIYLFIFMCIFFKIDFFFFFFFSLSSFLPLSPTTLSSLSSHHRSGQIRPPSRPTQALRRSSARGRAKLGRKPCLAARSAHAHRANRPTWAARALSPGLAATVSSFFELSHGSEHLHLA